MQERTHARTHWTNEISQELQWGDIRRELMTYCKRLPTLVDDVEDIVQSALVKTFLVLSSTKSHPNCSALVRTIARNTWVDHVRKQSKITPVDDLSTLCLPSESAPIEMGLEVDDALHRIWHVLTPNQRIVFLLCDVFEYTDTETAQMLRMSRGAVKAALHRARMKLQSQSASEEVTPHAVQTDEVQYETLQAYVSAFHSADVQALIQLCQTGTMNAHHATCQVLSTAKQYTQMNESPCSPKAFRCAA